MGCINSKKELSDINPNIYRVINIDKDGNSLWSGQLGITRNELTLYRKGKEPTRWPLACLRRYGYDAELFSFESGRRCQTGAGIYAFRCQRAESLFQTLQSYIQLPITTEDGLLPDTFPVPLASNGPMVGPRSRGSAEVSLAGGRSGINNTSSSTYIITNRPTSQNLSPSGTIQSSSNRSRSSDTLNGESNYLQPTPNRPPPMSRFNVGLRLGSVSSGPLSPDPHSPGSPNSITNILEVTPLNPLPATNPGISNVYQEFPIRDPSLSQTNNINTNNNNNNNNNNLNEGKRLSLDIPPQEPAPSLNFPTIKGLNAAPINCTDETKISQSLGYLLHSDSIDSSHMYMNVTPGDIVGTSKTKSAAGGTSGGSDTPQSVQTPTTTSTMFSLNRMNSTFSIDPNRCYENLEPSRDLRPMLLRNRLSKPDIFAGKLELCGSTIAGAVTGGTSSDKSEPSTPTNRRCNYIVLDLDQTSSLPPSTSAATVSSSSTTMNGSILSNSSGTAATSTATTVTSNALSFGLLLPPDSPKKGVFDYATIDFNKTVALSNSTTPSSELDSEGSRQTRHSSTALMMGKQSSSISD